MKSFLSWDCADKTLSWARVTVDPGQLVRARLAAGRARESVISGDLPAAVEALNEASEALAAVVRMPDGGVRDILGGAKVRDVGEVQRAVLLKAFLAEMPVAEGERVIIEKQPPALGFSKAINNKSTIVEHHLVYHYVDSRPRMISPTHKNGICLFPGGDYATYLRRETPKHKSLGRARYAARKQHSTDNFLQFCRVMGTQYDRSIRAAEVNNLADAFLQVLGYIREVGWSGA